MQSKAVDGLSNEKVPSELNRGEGTEAEYYIFKIDICSSTALFFRRAPQTYFKVAHVFLSTIDNITRDYGADTKQVEYAGDSVIAYFPNYIGMAVEVLKAAYLSRLAALKMKTLDTTFNTFPFRTKTVLHYGKLILGKIGPWGDYNLTAIGLPIHHVAKLEKAVLPGSGLATKEFATKLSLTERNNLLIPNFIEHKVEIQNLKPSPLNPPTISNALAGLAAYKPVIPEKNNLSAIAGLSNPNPAYRRMSDLPELFNPTSNLDNITPQYKTEKELVNYNVNWERIRFLLEGKLKL